MISIDNRVGSKELEPIVTAPCKLVTLQFADAAFMGNGPDGPTTIGVERKTLGDMISSIDSGRLAGHQLVGLCNSYEQVYLLLEGKWEEDLHTGLLMHFKHSRWFPFTLGTRQFMGSYLTGFLNTIAAKCGVKIWYSPDLGHSGRWLTQLYRWWQKDWDKHKGLNAFHVTTPPQAMMHKPSVTHKMIKELSGVGWGKSVKLLEKFPTMFKLLCAKKEELMEVEGIGKTLADSIWNELLYGRTK
ncbi:hypothetical protein LCGC14_0613830 [marine sediment metagenome]|uniref:ERCC4 domain-containing protein n=1 Tax=marine sediment metagenome TaxID=412755 RepID=A0A0F9UFB8_9ZZZZ